MTENLKVLVYSDNRIVRDQVRLTLGKRVASDLPELEIHEVATHAAVFRALDDLDADWSLVILDGEAQPSGGFGISFQMKDEYEDAPPVLLLVKRDVDSWLASWSRADAIAPYPLDPFRLPQQAAELLRVRVSA